jgi:hypothetical protein
MPTTKLPTKFLLLLPLVTIMLISGCTGPGPGGGGSQGVVIVEWVPDFAVVDSYDQFQILLKIKNLGGVEARDVEATLFGVTPSEWGVFDERIDMGNLLPADPRYGTEGAEEVAILVLEAPEFPQGTLNERHPSVRVAYEYSTIATKTITIVGESELRALELQGGTLPTSQTEVTAGPIGVAITVGNLIKASQSGSRNTEFPLTITLTNVGGGRIQEKTPFPEDPLQFVAAIDLRLPSGLRFTDECQTMDRVTFWRGQEAEVSCNVEILDSSLIAEEKTLNIELGYEYLIDAITTISVRGTEEPTVPPPVGGGPTPGWNLPSGY